MNIKPFSEYILEKKDPEADKALMELGGEIKQLFKKHFPKGNANIMLHSDVVEPVINCIFTIGSGGSGFSFMDDALLMSGLVVMKPNGMYAVDFNDPIVFFDKEVKGSKKIGSDGKYGIRITSEYAKVNKNGVIGNIDKLLSKVKQVVKGNEKDLYKK